MAIAGADVAYLQSRSGIARSGAIRSGYYFYNLVVMIRQRQPNGSDVMVDYTARILWDSLTIHKSINDEYDTAACSLIARQDPVPHVGELFTVGLGTGAPVDRIYTGQISRVSFRWRAGFPDPWCDVEVVDSLARFDAPLVTTDYTNQDGTSIILDVVTNWVQRLVAPFGVQHVAPNLPVIAYLPATNQRPSEIIRTVTDYAGGGFYLDATLDLHAWGSGGDTGAGPAPQPLTWQLSSLKAFAVSTDSAPLRTRVRVEGIRTRSRIATVGGVAGAALDSLPVGDLAGWPASGRARIGINAVTYGSLYQPPADLTVWLVEVYPPSPAFGPYTLWCSPYTRFVNANVPQAGWVIVANQIVRYTKWEVRGADDTLILTLPPPGTYGALPTNLIINAHETVDVLPWLQTIGTEDGRAFHEQPTDTDVVLVMQRQDDAAIAAWAIPTVSTGIVEHVVSDGRLTADGAARRAVAELDDFKYPTVTATWETDDLHAEVGRLQQIALAPPGAIKPPDTSLTILEVEITFPVPGRPPRRRCRGALARSAKFLDIVMTERT